MKISRFLLYLFLSLLLLSTVFAANKPIAGQVLLHNTSLGINASVIIYVNASDTSEGNWPCRTVPTVVTASDGNYSTDLSNLKKNDGIANCNGNWVAGDPIWAEADGTSVTPVAGNGTSNFTTIASGSGLQLLPTVSVEEGPDLVAPTVTLITPINDSLSQNGSVDFIFNVSDERTVDNCSLYFDGTLNSTDTSITENTTNTIGLTRMADDIYNWSVNCSDASNNVGGTSEFLLNVSKIGTVVLDLITPTGDTDVEQYEHFTFTTQVTCQDGSCGEINMSLDPIGPEHPKSFWTFIINVIKHITSGNLLTGLAAGNLVPTTDTTPFWTNESNPQNSTHASCLSDMTEGASCNVSWTVNASGAVDITREFFVFANSTTYTNITNESARMNITIAETINPAVFALIPTADTTFNVSNVIEIGTNATDATNISHVFANITFPNATVQTLTLSNISNTNGTWNTSFTLPNITGNFDVLFIANDTENNVNTTETTNFTVNDVTAPSVFDILPESNTSFNVSDRIQLGANITDDVNISRVFANVTLPNGTISEFELTLTQNDFYNVSYTIPLLLGQYNLTIIANDSTNNRNNSETSFFVGSDTAAPSFASVSEIPADGFTYSSGQVYEFNISIDDNIALNNVAIEFDGTNYTSEINTSGSIRIFNQSDLGVASYNYTWYANDTSSNENKSSQTYTIAQASSSVNLSVNGQDTNITLEANTTINLTGTRLTGEGNIRLYRDNVELSDDTSVISNNSAFHTLGQYTIVVNYTNTQNFSASSETHTITVQDTTNPKVVDVLPTQNTKINVSDPLHIAANVTDNVSVGAVEVNISLPNGTIDERTLSRDTNNRYNVSYTIPALIGDYTLTYITNDTSNNTNTSVTSNFTVVDQVAPNVTGLQPVLNSVFTQGGVEIAINTSDNVNISTVLANITFPNATIEQVTLNIESNDRYNNTFTAPALAGSYNITFIVNDTSNNKNTTESTNFSIQDTSNPSVGSLTPNAEVHNISDLIEINATVTDDVGVSQVFVNITYPDTSVSELELNLHGSNVYNTTLTAPSVIGTYNITYIANDTDGNFNTSETSTFTVNDDPNVTTLIPAINTAFNLTNTIEIAINVTDLVGGTSSASANITYPNGTRTTLTLANGSAHPLKFNVSLSVPSLLGTYNLTFFANDTYNKVNQTEISNFSVNDVLNPSVSLNTPLAGTGYDSGEKSLITATVTDDFNLSTVIANITIPNGTVELLTLEDVDGDNLFNATFVRTDTGGTYTLLMLANDSSGNLNNSVTRTFTVAGTGAPTITLFKVTPQSVFNGSAVVISMNATDASGLDSCWANVSAPNGSLDEFTDLCTSNTTYYTSDIGTYNITFYANDTSSNEANETINFNATEVVSFTILTNTSSAPVDTNVTLFLNSDNAVVNFNSTQGLGNITAGHDMYDILVQAHKDKIRVKIKNVNISSESGKTVGLDQLSTAIDGYNITYGVTVEHTFTNATIDIYYDTENFSNEETLELFLCSNWSFTNQTCQETFQNITANTTLDTNLNYFQYNTTSFSGFAINQSKAPVSSGSSSSSSSSSSSGGGGGSSSSSGGGGGSGQSGCVTGYEKINGVCVHIETGEEQPIVCGNGIVESGESCDPPAESCQPTYGESCEYCNERCQMITVPTQEFCGDSIINGQESCDETIPTSCQQEGFHGGDPSCVNCQIELDACWLQCEVNTDCPGLSRCSNNRCSSYVGSAISLGNETLNKAAGHVFSVIIILAGTIWLLLLILLLWKHHHKFRIRVHTPRQIMPGQELNVMITIRNGHQDRRIRIWGVLAPGGASELCALPAKKAAVYVVNLNPLEIRQVTIKMSLPENLPTGSYDICTCIMSGDKDVQSVQRKIAIGNKSIWNWPQRQKHIIVENPSEYAQELEKRRLNEIALDRTEAEAHLELERLHKMHKITSEQHQLEDQATLIEQEFLLRKKLKNVEFEKAKIGSKRWWKFW